MKGLIEKYKEIKNMPKGNAYLFFGFYFIFFIIVIMMIRQSPKTVKEDLEENDERHYMELGAIRDLNYQFEYVVDLDGVVKKYRGEKYQEKELFTYQDKNYYYDGNHYYIKDNMKWVKSENPYSYKEFMNLDKISKFLDTSYIESETTYKSGKTSIRFYLDTNLIYQNLYDRNTDYDDEGNYIVVNLYDDKVESVIFQLDHYCISSSICKKNFKIEIDYDKVGEIEEIQKPV